MKQTKGSDGWVYIVLHTDTLTYQVFDDARPPRRTPRWVRILIKVFAVGKQVYSLTV